MVAGIDIRRDHAIVALTDLNASILESLRVNYPVGSKPEEVFTLLVSGFHQLIKKASNPKAPRLVGIGIGIPGVIDYDANSLVLADTMKGWQGCDIGGMFERQFGVSTFVENDVKTRTLGEYLFGAAKGCTDSIYLWIGSGIGAGIIINGKLHRGFTSSAGEVGYNELGSFLRDRDRYPILYRSQQDFGDILSDGNIIQSYNNGQHNGHQTVSTVEEIVQLSVQGDQHAAQTIEEATSLLSVVCIGLINTLNPEVIILGGGMIHAHESILKTVQSKIRADILSVPAEAVRIEAARLVEDGTIRGAVGLVLYELFEPIHSASFRKKMTLRSA
jgi:predicted NBD/HSP70 family sugar kinase